MPLAVSMLSAKVLILVKAFMNFERKLKDVFSVFNVFGKSIDFSNGIREL